MYDINAVCSLLKQFFRELPIPLFTQDQYGKFIAAASTFTLGHVTHDMFISANASRRNTK